MNEVKAWEVLKSYKLFDLKNDTSDFTAYISITPGIVCDDYYLRYTDYDNPVVCNNERIYKTNYIYINEEYLKNNYDYVIECLVNFISNYRKSKLKILSSNLINDKVLEVISNNKNIFMVSLGSKEDPYTLNRKIFDILNKSDNLFEIDTDLVVGSYSNEEKEYISWYNKKYLVENYSYNALSYNTSFVFTKPLSDVQIKYLGECISDNVFIRFIYNDFDNILKIIDILKDRNVTFVLNNMNEFLEYREKFKKYLNKEKILTDKNVNFDKYLNNEELLDLMIKDIKNSGLSLFEKYLAVFNIVKWFKSYRSEGSEYSKNSPLSYEVYEILKSDYIVCLGYSNLFIDLLSRIGISATNISVEVYKDREEITLEDMATMNRDEIKAKEGYKEFHSRVIVRLIDSKYNIDGIFIGDPTWDSVLSEDYYNHAIMTPFETNFENKVFYNTLVDIFNVSSGSEFYIKLEKFPEAIDYFLGIVKIIDFDFYKLLNDKYDLCDNKYATEFYLDVYNYIITHTKKIVGKDILYKAVDEVLKFTYCDMNEEKRVDLLNKIFDNNVARHDEFFPPIYKDEEIIANSDNKFKR